MVWGFRGCRWLPGPAGRRPGQRRPGGGPWSGAAAAAPAYVPASPVRPRRRPLAPTAQKTTPASTITANAPSVTDSKKTRDTPQLLDIEYDSPNTALVAPGHSSVIAVTMTKSSQITAATQAPAMPPGTRYGRGTSGYLRRSATRAGNTKT